MNIGELYRSLILGKKLEKAHPLWHFGKETTLMRLKQKYYWPKRDASKKR